MPIWLSVLELAEIYARHREPDPRGIRVVQSPDLEHVNPIPDGRERIHLDARVR